MWNAVIRRTTTTTDRPPDDDRTVTHSHSLSLTVTVSHSHSLSVTVTHCQSVTASTWSVCLSVCLPVVRLSNILCDERQHY